MTKPISIRRQLLDAAKAEDEGPDETTELMRALHEAHMAASEMGQALRATIKDLNQNRKEEEQEEDAEFKALRAEVASLHERLLSATAAAARAEGECAGLRQMVAAYEAEEKSEAQPIVIPPAAVNVTQGGAPVRMDVIRDSGGQIRSFKLIREE